MSVTEQRVVTRFPELLLSFLTAYSCSALFTGGSNSPQIAALESNSLILLCFESLYVGEKN